MIRKRNAGLKEEQLSRYLTYRDAARQQLSNEPPSPEFAERLMLSLHKEMEQTPSKPLMKRHSNRSRSVLRLAYVAASLVILAGIWTLFAHLGKSEQTTSLSLMETTAAAQMDSAAGNAMPETALAPDATGAGDAEVMSQPAANESAQAKLFAEAPDAWRVISPRDALPLTKRSVPDTPILAGDIFEGARAVIWVEPNRLVVAWPLANADETLARLMDKLEQMDPDWKYFRTSASDVSDLLEEWLGSAAEPAWANLEQPDCDYLILEFGGT